MRTSALLDLHDAAGARILDQASPPQLLTYGDVPAEYEAGIRGCALFDQTDRGCVAVAGSEAALFLHRILANDVRTLAAGRGNRNLLLTGKGKIRFDFDLALEADGVRISTSPGRAEALLAAFDTYLFTEDVQLADRTDRHAPLAVCGAAAAEVVRDVCGVPPPVEDHATVEGVADGDLVRITRLPVAGSAGWRLDVGPDRVRDLWETLVERGARPAGIVARDCLRVEAVSALDGVDIDENVYPQEARLEPAFSLTKGCYIGQEVVAKIDTYGGLNKLLFPLRISHDDPVPRGTRLMQKGAEGEARELGIVTSWAYSFALDTGLVLAYVKRKHQELGTAFTLDGTDATATIVEGPVREGALPLA